MIMSGGVSTGVTTVDCEKQVRSWRLLRAIAELLIPSCTCIVTQDDNLEISSPKSTLITGTLFGNRRGKVNFCIQTSPNSILLLELAIPTNVLAKEMKGGSIRFAFECKSDVVVSGSVLSMPTWTMYCNGRKLGFAVKRKPSEADMEVLRKIENVVVGAGIAENDVMYLRGKFERFHASPNSESFHLIDPDASKNGQELSFYFLRSC